MDGVLRRQSFADLAHWHRSSGRKPLVIRGARQVGKSSLVREFAREQGLTLWEVNLERAATPLLNALKRPVQECVALLGEHFGGQVTDRTLLFFDEIQVLPELYAKLRYFFEDSPRTAVIAAGSLLEHVLAEADFSMPVGRVEFLFMGPFSFTEFLEAKRETMLLERIRSWRPGEIFSETLHERGLRAAREFARVGGMPEAVRHHVTHPEDFDGISRIHRALLTGYREDFHKYHRRVPIERLQHLFEQLPREIGRKWVHARVESDAKAGQVSNALKLLERSGLCQLVRHSGGNGVPLGAEVDPRIFKPLFLDVGLVSSALGLRGIDIQDLSLVNEGAVAEQWVGQELLHLRPSYEPPSLFYWMREKTGSLAEVDYLFTEGPSVYPVEVKAGKTGRLRSLQLFLKEKPKAKLGIRIFGGLPEWEQPILHLPFYLTSEIPRILGELR